MQLLTKKMITVSDVKAVKSISTIIYQNIYDYSQGNKND